MNERLNFQPIDIPAISSDKLYKPLADLINLGSILVWLDYLTKDRSFISVRSLLCQKPVLSIWSTVPSRETWKGNAVRSWPVF